jgi:hypothetical protein
MGRIDQAAPGSAPRDQEQEQHIDEVSDAAAVDFQGLVVESKAYCDQYEQKSCD